ncbi:MAG: FCSD flavin-binding domain-containing protein [Albidovulum sp.]|nr:FCSD flavin-binding domain-containing protein [Albidovulum sp.]
MTDRATRRETLAILGAASVAGLAAPRLNAQAGPRVVVVGGGFGGASCARYLRKLAPEVAATLVDPAPAIVTCPFSNTVIAGLNEIETITHGFDGLRAAGVEVVQDAASAIDLDAREVRLAGGARLGYDRLVVSPGIDFKPNAVEGYDGPAIEVMPHAWKGGEQTLLLRRQIESMPDGGTVVMTVPANPIRCPPGPYERASLIAWHLKARKPRSKLLVVDAKDNFSKQGLFNEAWAALYSDLIEWVPFAQAGNLLRVDPATMTVETEFERFRGSVVNVIPPQRAAGIAVEAGLTGGEDWCEVNQATFESVEAAGVHVLGDSAIAGAMPKSGFSAGSQGKFCAAAIAAMLKGDPAPEPSLINTCYSLVAPNYAISVAAVYRLEEGKIVGVEGAGGVSPSDASAEFREAEADYARGWYASITSEIYG